MKARFALTCLAMMLCAMLVRSQAPPSSRPVYEVWRTDQPIKVDGVLDDSAWAKTPALSPLVNNRDGSASPLKSECKVLYDDKFIYFASRFQDENVWATMKKRDEHLWTEEVMEVFLRADRTQKSYVEIEVNPLGTLIDIFLLDIRKPLHYESWNSEKIQWAVQVDGTVDGQAGDKGWSCEIALPLEDVLPAPNTPPKPGDRWLMNMYRVEKLPEKASLAWSPTGMDFHQPDKFGEIVFTDHRIP